MKEQQNFLAAIVLSLAVLLGWQFFVVEPRMAAERAQRLAAAQSEEAAAQNGTDMAPQVENAPQADGLTGAAPQPTPSGVQNKATQALADSPRLPIRTAQLEGSIALIGARIDDLTLTAYRQSIEENAASQKVLQPAIGETYWQARHGWVAAADSGITLPDENTLWQIERGATLTPQTPVTLVHTTPEGIVLRQQIAVDENYMFTITQSAVNDSAANVTLYPFSQIERRGLPDNNNLFILHEGAIGYFGETGLQEIDYDDILDEGQVKHEAMGGWLGFTDKYWASAIIPPQDTKFTGRFVASLAGEGQAVYRSDFLLPGIALAAGAQAATESRFFAGAKQVDLVDAYAENGVTRFDLMIDWGWFYFLTKPMFKALQLFYQLLGNYGLSILIVTVLVKLAFFPLANRSYETMAKMKKLQPRLLQIREVYKDDRQAQQQEMMKMYREEKLNPLAGCLPMLLQIPVFFALYKVLFVTIDMRHQPFFGWITDLSAPDPTSLFNLFGLLPYDVPAILLIGVWPLIMGVTMFVQMQMNPPPPDPVQARMFQIMPIFFTFLLASFPAGLVIYWAWNNFLSILQQGFIMRRNGVAIELLANLGFGKRAQAEAGGDAGQSGKDAG